MNCLTTFIISKNNHESSLIKTSNFSIKINYTNALTNLTIPNPHSLIFTTSIWIIKPIEFISLHNLTSPVSVTWPLMTSSPPSTRNIANNIEKQKNIETGYELSFISRIFKEQGVGGINRKQEYDFYTSSLENEQCIRYLQKKTKTPK